MAKEPKYRTSTRRELPEARWRMLGVALALLGIALLVILVGAVLVALGVISG
ncbi:MAG TPA: hypothetical protein VFZ66_11930 [Herpetosiphonaceae bacterium]